MNVVFLVFIINRQDSLWERQVMAAVSKVCLLVVFMLHHWRTFLLLVIKLWV